MPDIFVTRPLPGKGLDQLRKADFSLEVYTPQRALSKRTLVKALRNNTIAAAALDVFENEPHLAPGLTRLQEVLLTPHTASFTHETRCRMVEIVAKDVLITLRGSRPKHLVNGF